jgi:demethylmenaquinone methyltransferase/2-methoxy-6-polyprenyl-1,4-benzoquinol methylase
MLEIAARRAREAALSQRIEFVEMGVAELDREEPRSYDAVTSVLCFSELSEDERAYALAQALRILKPGGLLLLADEVRPGSLARRILFWLVRAPLAALAWLVTQQTTHPIAGLADAVVQAGFAIVAVRSNGLGSFAELVARRPAGEGA